jgi:hypothetical protein
VETSDPLADPDVLVLAVRALGWEPTVLVSVEDVATRLPGVTGRADLPAARDALAFWPLRAARVPDAAPWAGVWLYDAARAVAAVGELESPWPLRATLWWR